MKQTQSKSTTKRLTIQKADKGHLPLKDQIIDDTAYIGLLERYIDINGRRVACSGLTGGEVNEILVDRRIIKQFGNWMTGQTCAGHELLGLLTYSHDLYHFIGTLRGKKTYWD